MNHHEIIIKTRPFHQRSRPSVQQRSQLELEEAIHFAHLMLQELVEPAGHCGGPPVVPIHQWIGWRENLQETMVCYHQI